MRRVHILRIPVVHLSFVVSSLWPAEGCPLDCWVGMEEEVACEWQLHLLMCSSSLIAKFATDAFPVREAQSEMLCVTVLVSE